MLRNGAVVENFEAPKQRFSGEAEKSGEKLQSG